MIRMRQLVFRKLFRTVARDRRIDMTASGFRETIRPIFPQNTSRRSPSTKRRLLFIGLVLCLLCNVAGCRPSPSPAQPQTGVPGVSDTQVRLGSSLALKGHAGYLGTQTLHGAMAYINSINAQGGVHGRKINVTAYDDGYDPPRCLANTQRLIVEDNVFALFSYVGTPTTVKILPMVEEAGIPLLGMFTGANALREPFNRWVINVRSSYYQETRAAVRFFLENLKLRRIAVFYQYDAYGFDGLTGTELALKEFGLAPVARGSYIRGTLDVEDGLNRIITSGADAVVMIGTYDPCAKFIKLALQKGFNPLFYNVSFVGAEELARRLADLRQVAVIMSQVVPPPEGLRDGYRDDEAEEYIRLLQASFPEDKPNFVSFEGYINARVLVEGLRRAGRELTRDKFIRGIESIRNFSPGLDVDISFNSSDHQGMERVYFTRLTQGKFKLIDDWQMVKAELDRRNRQSPEQ